MKRLSVPALIMEIHDSREQKDFCNWMSDVTDPCSVTFSDRFPYICWVWTDEPRVVVLVKMSKWSNRITHVNLKFAK